LWAAAPVSLLAAHLLAAADFRPPRLRKIVRHKPSVVR
jgi:hypothetical protein